MIVGLPLMLGTNKSEEVEEGEEPKTWRETQIRERWLTKSSMNLA